jgi:aryl-alcohol dehydrogenase-like predicted oxidoreductase
MPTSFDRAVLGRTGLDVCRLGISASYGMTAAGVERAIDAGVNYVYFGTFRKNAFAEGVRNSRRHRDSMALVVQSYSPIGSYLGASVERALRALRFDHADILLLGMWNRPVPPRVLDSVRQLKDRGLVRFLAVSTHRRPLVPKLAPQSDYDLFHVRYNAAHTGAERDIFPHLDRTPSSGGRPGIVSFTATCWGQLLKSRKIPKNEKTPTAGDCYRFVLSNPAVDVCMTGLGNDDQTTHALEALRKGPLSADEMAWMRRVGAAIHGKN